MKPLALLLRIQKGTERERTTEERTEPLSHAQGTTIQEVGIPHLNGLDKMKDSLGPHFVASVDRQDTCLTTALLHRENPTRERSVEEEKIGRENNC